MFTDPMSLQLQPASCRGQNLQLSERDRHRVTSLLTHTKILIEGLALRSFFSPSNIISTMQVDDRYHCVFSFLKKSQGSNQISHIHRHLLHSCIVKRLNVPKNPLVLLSDKVDSNSFSAKTATTTNSGQNNRGTVLDTHEILKTCNWHYT